jgi:hypothetical protein
VLRAKNEDYVGSYYHLAKLLERTGEREQGIAVYEKGLAKSKALGDNHAYNELLAAYEDFTDFKCPTFVRRLSSAI